MSSAYVCQVTFELSNREREKAQSGFSKKNYKTKKKKDFQESLTSKRKKREEGTSLS